MSTKDSVSKEDLARVVASTYGLSLGESKMITDTILGGIINAVAKGCKVSLYKFGSFTPYVRKAYMGHNPQTGECISIPMKNKVKFHAFSAFLSQLAGNCASSSHKISKKAAKKIPKPKAIKKSSRAKSKHCL